MIKTETFIKEKTKNNPQNKIRSYTKDVVVQCQSCNIQYSIRIEQRIDKIKCKRCGKKTLHIEATRELLGGKTGLVINE